MNYCARCGWYYPRLDLAITSCHNPETHVSEEGAR